MKMFKNIFCFIVVFCFLSFLFTNATNQAAAGDSLWDRQDSDVVSGLSGSFSDDGDPTDVRKVVVDVIKVFLGFLGLIFLILIIWAGTRWMISRGNQEEVGVAKAQIIAAIIGFTIIALSYVIVKFVDDTIRTEMFDRVW